MSLAFLDTISLPHPCTVSTPHWGLSTISSSLKIFGSRKTVARSIKSNKSNKRLEGVWGSCWPELANRTQNAQEIELSRMSAVLSWDGSLVWSYPEQVSWTSPAWEPTHSLAEVRSS